jgi:invasin-like protein
MKPNDAIRAAAVAAVFAASFASVQAAGPFQVRRATTGAAVSTATPVATIATAPYDDTASLLSASSYYYGVYDASGAALEISVQTNPTTQAIRIGFDDGNPASASVDASTSSVVVAPASIRADGLQVASITITPRDAYGVLLGRGLSISIDSSLLWPALLSGPIVDLGDGSYTAQAVASVPGTGAVRVFVEGVSLAPLPTITATALDPSGSLRDLAIAELSGMAGPGGPLEALSANATARAKDALLTLANDDPARDDNVLKTDLDAVLSQLAGLLSSPGALDPQDVRDAMDDILGVARLIAQWHVDRATAACGVCDGSGRPKKVCDAIAALASADAMRAAISPDYGAVADEYARAVESALQAVHAC